MSTQVLAYAKINLSLEVMGRRSDGYHDLATVMHTVDLADRLTFQPADTLSLACKPPVGEPEQNLVMRAARLLQEHTGCTSGARVRLTKRIPAASGLGGGSSDAAATLKALNALWDTGLSNAALGKLAARLGSDVPFFLEGGCALAQGRGDLVTPLPPAPAWWAVILRPPFDVEAKTARMYSLLGPQDFTDGLAARALAEKLRSGTASLSDVARAPNTFERAAGEAFPGLDRYRRALAEAGADFARLCGSGPALFSLLATREAAREVAGQLKASGHEAYVARLIGPRDSRPS